MPEVKAHPPAGRRMRGGKPQVNRGGRVLPKADFGGAGGIRLHIAVWGGRLVQVAAPCVCQATTEEWPDRSG